MAKNFRIHFANGDTDIVQAVDAVEAREIGEDMGQDVDRVVVLSEIEEPEPDDPEDHEPEDSDDDDDEDDEDACESENPDDEE